MRYSTNYIDSLFAQENPTESVTGIINIASCNPSLDATLLDGKGYPLFNLLMYINYTGDVGNGGHAQYFWNSYSDHVVDTLAALDEIGLPKFRSILEEALTIFEDGTPPKDKSQRERIVTNLRDENFIFLQQCDHALYEIYNDDAEKKAQAYMLAQRSRIIPHLCFK